MIHETFEDFMRWWKSMNPSEQIDHEEALEIFFNQESYELEVVI